MFTNCWYTGDRINWGLEHQTIWKWSSPQSRFWSRPSFEKDFWFKLNFNISPSQKLAKRQFPHHRKLIFSPHIHLSNHNCKRLFEYDDERLFIQWFHFSRLALPGNWDWILFPIRSSRSVLEILLKQNSPVTANSKMPK